MLATAKEQLTVLAALNQTTAAALVGIKRETLKSSDAPRKEDGTYEAKALVAWAIERAKQSACDDPLLTGGDSPNLERYRAAKAELAEMDAAERRGELINVNELCDWWLSEIAPQIRLAIEEIARLSQSAEQVMLAAIDKACQAVQKHRPDDRRDAE